jgi:ATP-dependent Zn protease
MGTTTGLIIYDPDSGPVSGDTHARMDADVRALLDAAYDEVLTMLRGQRAALEALADALIERETLTGAEALGVVQDAGMPPRGVAA